MRPAGVAAATWMARRTPRTPCPCRLGGVMAWRVRTYDGAVGTPDQAAGEHDGQRAAGRSPRSGSSSVTRPHGAAPGRVDQPGPQPREQPRGHQARRVAERNADKQNVVYHRPRAGSMRVQRHGCHRRGSVRLTPPSARHWFCLGLSAAFGGTWVERRGPRVAAIAAALLFGSGLILGGIGLALSQSWLVFLGMGVVGGMGCGLGYIAPVSTLVKWFPDRRGMATGMAIMGFGGGAFLAGYLNVYFMNRLGVARTIIALGIAYFIIMMIGAAIIRRPPAGWKPQGWTPPVNVNKMITDRNLTRNAAIQTVQFYLLWGFCLST